MEKGTKILKPQSAASLASRAKTAESARSANPLNKGVVPDSGSSVKTAAPGRAAAKTAPGKTSAAKTGSRKTSAGKGTASKTPSSKKTPSQKASAKAVSPKSVELKASPFTYRGFTAWRWDLASNLVYFTHDWAQLFKPVPEFPYQTTAEKCWSHVCPDDVEMLETATEGIFSGNSRELDLAIRLRRADGGWAWTLGRGRVVEEKDGEPAIVVGINVTISRLRSDPVFQQNGIAASNPAYQGIIESSSGLCVPGKKNEPKPEAAPKQAVQVGKAAPEELCPENIPLQASPFTYYDFTAWKWDTETNLVRFTHDWAQLFGLSSDSAFQTTLEQCWNQVCSNDMEVLQQAFSDILDGSSKELDIATRLRRPDGGWAWTLSRGRVVEEKDGKPALVAGVNISISRLRSDPVFQQNGIGVSSTAYHAMLENSPDMIVRMDRELFPLYMNPKVGEYFKRQREEFTGYDTVAELEMDPRQMKFLLHYVEKVFNEKVTIREMLTFRNSYGRDVTGEYSFWPEFDTYGNVVSVITQFRDLTEQIQAEEKARLNESRLNALNQLTQMESSSEEEVINFVLSSMRDLTDSASSAIFIPDNEVMGQGHLYWSMSSNLSTASLRSSGTTVLPKELISLLGAQENNLALRGIVNGDGKSALFSPDEWDMPVRRIAVAPSTNDNR